MRVGLLIFLCASVVHADAPSGTATVPLTDLIALQKKLDRESITSIEEAIVRGRYRQDLTLTVRGRATGTFVKKAFLAASEQFRLSGCRGAAIIEREEADLVLQPLKADFEVTCNLAVNDWNELRIEVKNALFSRAEIEGADLLDQNKDAFVLVPKHKEQKSDRELPVTAEAHYRVSLLTDETRFLYAVTLHNPSKSLRPFSIALKNGETVRRVETAAHHEDTDSAINLTLDPGDTEVTLEGALPGTHFAPLLDSEQQFLIIDSHPVLQAEIETHSRRIAASEAGIGALFNNARAFLVGKNGAFDWKTKKLDTFSSVGYSVHSATYAYFVPESGAPLIEAMFSIENQGVPEMALPVPGEVTYLSINGVPQALYKDSQGRLLIQMPTGNETILVQYRPAARKGGGIAHIADDLVRPDNVVSNVSLSLHLPPSWRAPFARALGSSETFISFEHLPWLMLAALAMLFMARVAGARRRSQATLVLLLLVTGIFIPEIAPPFLALSVVAMIVRKRGEIGGAFTRRPIVSVGSLIFIGFAGFLLFGTMSRSYDSRSYAGVAPDSRFAQFQIAEPTPTPTTSAGRSGLFGMKGEASAHLGSVFGKQKALGAEAEGVLSGLAGAEAPNQSELYKGLPTRIEMPGASQSLRFNQALLDKSNSVKISALLVSSAAFDWTSRIAVALLLLMIVLERKKWLAFVKIDTVPSAMPVIEPAT